MSILSSFLTRSILTQPHHLSDAAWAGHIPFAFWLVEKLAPRLFVELGAHTGNSYAAFCQAIEEFGYGCEAYAVDTWRGDDHAGYYGDEVFAEFAAYHEPRYGAFSKLLRMTFDEAQPTFRDGSVDLLHIDGLHTYEAARHDFENWRAKLSDRAVVLFHDIAVRRDDFGVFRLWDEVKTQHPYFDFLHCNGLGVLGIGGNLPEALRSLFSSSEQSKREIRILFDRLGRTLTDRLAAKAAAEDHASTRNELTELAHHHRAAMRNIEELRKQSDHLAVHLGAATAERASLREELAKLGADASEREHALQAENQRLSDSLEQTRADFAATRLQGIALQDRVLRSEAQAAEFQAALVAVGSREGELRSALAANESRANELDRHLSTMIERTAAPRWLTRQLLWSLRERARAALRRTKPPTAAGSLTTAPAKAEALPELPDKETIHPRFLKVARRHVLGRIDAHSAERNVTLADLLPSSFSAPRAAGGLVDVIIPVYGGDAATRACIESVLRARPENAAFGRLILVDDCGPDRELRRWLRELQGEGVELLVNAENVGFVKSVNRGMRHAQDRDVVLLNSDTLVSSDWLDRLAAHARAEPTIGTVTPFSNNATICSLPDIGAFRLPPSGLDAAAVDAVAARTNAARRIDLPTAHGFCMFIVRACLENVGLFDEETWGRGYGEETDFSCRALANGWRHVLAADVFVFHQGGVSFSDSSEARRERAQTLMRALHPRYESSVARWVETDPALGVRLALLLALQSERAKGITILHVAHPWGGGTERQIAQIVSDTFDRAAHVILMLEQGAENLSCKLLLADDGGAWRELDFVVGDVSALSMLLSAIRPSRVHLHHDLAAKDAVFELLCRLDLPYDLSVHDYALICPRINLAREGAFCGEPDEIGCLDCLSEQPPARSMDIVWWRARGRQLLEHAARVICPTIDVGARILRYAPQAPIVVAPHEADLYQAPAIETRVPLLAADQPMRIACLGIIAVHKGGGFLLDTVEETRRAGVAAEWTVIGDLPEPLRTRASALGVAITGPYSGDEVAARICAADPHLVFFPQQCPETYSYTLSETLAAARAVLVPDLGAFRERVQGRAGAWIYSRDASPRDVADLIDRIGAQFADPSQEDQSQNVSSKELMRDRVYETDRNTLKVDLDFYKESYIAALQLAEAE